MAYYHLGEMIHHQAEKYKGRTALKYLSSEGKWIQMSWEELSGKIMQTARAMAELQIEPEENVGIYSQNMAKYLIT
ncbi:AMP-binding protein, partial [Petrimonas sp.]|uniref:AMP-binding protein n=1 Tax=Petrimonas sp. TaxID=2023866 RepID=UPI002B25784B